MQLLADRPFPHAPRNDIFHVSGGHSRRAVPPLSAPDRVTADQNNAHDASRPDPVDREDLGFGRLVAQQVRGRFLNRDGTPNSRKLGLGTQRVERLYLGALSASWGRFIGWSLAIVLLMNGCFALAYIALGTGAIGGQELAAIGDPFLSAFSFSLAIFTTSDASPMYAVGATAHWLTIIESLIGPLTLVMIAGLLIARLIRPRMRIQFSESAVVAPYEGGRGLMFRMVGMQRSDLSDVQVRVNLAVFEMQNGQRVREFHQLELERQSVEFFTLHWTVVHPLTAISPLAGFTPEMLRAAEAELLISVNAHEETFSTRVTARMSYTWEEVRWDAKFASIFVSAPEGQIAIDVERLDRLDTLPEGSTTVPAPSELAATRQTPVGRV
jgi:inward rectifier potassium channel